LRRIRGEGSRCRDHEDRHHKECDCRKQSCAARRRWTIRCRAHGTSRYSVTRDGGECLYFLSSL
jgi:hypothetical protein